MTSAHESHGDDQQIALGGVFTRQAGCLLIPFLPVRAAGGLIVTTSRIIFDPILHYKLFARKRVVPIDQVARAESAEDRTGLGLLDIVTFGKGLRVFLKSGGTLTFRSGQADELAEAINAVVEGRVSTAAGERSGEDDSERENEGGPTASE